MKFKELLDRLNQIASGYPDYKLDNLKIVIRVERVGTVGGTPTVNVKALSQGIDWDDGKLILHTEESLRETNRDEIKAIWDKYDELGWKKYKIDGLKRENKLLKKRIEELEKGNEQKN